MKYVSIDIETTGLAFNSQILQIGLAIEDTNNIRPIKELPTKTIWINHDKLTVEAGALKLHSMTGFWEKYFKASKTNYHEVVESILLFLTHYKSGELVDGIYKFNVAGKNYNSFDRVFLEKLTNWTNTLYARRRALDPAMMYIDWFRDLKLPNQDLCLKRAGIDETVSHDALEDAIQVVKLLRQSYS